MAGAPEPADPKGENARRWQVSRRHLLKLMGAAGVVAVAAPLVPSLVGKVNAQPAETKTAGNRRLRAWTMVIDLRRCDGCQSQGTPPRCTTACVQGHFAPEPMEWIEVYEHELGRDTSEVKALDSASEAVPAGTRFMPTPCMQCQNPPCVNVCPVGATWSTPEGVVLIDQQRCIGCRMCMAACPYERRFFTWGEPATPAAAMFVDRSVEHQVPMQKGVVYKCDFCPEMARAGRLPFCAQACPQNAIYYGDLEEGLVTNGEEIEKLGDFLADNSAFRYKEELRTRPRVYYIPGHGELAGRDQSTRGRLPVRWPADTRKGTKTWRRSSD